MRSPQQLADFVPIDFLKVLRDLEQANGNKDGNSSAQISLNMAKQAARDQEQRVLGLFAKST